MHYSKIYIQDNFVPNVVEDPFRRKVIGIEVSLNEGESMADAKLWAEHYIKDYIKENIVYPDHAHIEETIIPAIQVEKPRSENDILIDGINSCTDITVLKSYGFLTRKSPELQEIYKNKLSSLQNSKK